MAGRYASAVRRAGVSSSQTLAVAAQPNSVPPVQTPSNRSIAAVAPDASSQAKLDFHTEIARPSAFIPAS